jgi:arginyl-tRNA synthetase
MKLSPKEDLNAALRSAVEAVAGKTLEEMNLASDRCTFGPTKNPEHGDLASNAAMLIAKPLGRNPMDVAAELATHLQRNPIVALAEPAKPGFVNVRLSLGAFASVLALIQEQQESYGDSTYGQKRRVLLEFVSANPTGPMHLGHCRHAATGDALARILRAASFEVTTEFYINDAGVQIRALGRSFRYACLKAASLLDAAALREEPDAEIPGKTHLFYEDEKVQYTGAYMEEFASHFVAHHSPETLLGMSVDQFAWEARNSNLSMIKDDLAAMGVVFDNYVSEKALHEAGAVDATMTRLRDSGRTYAKDGATWLMTQDYGDSEDRVMVKGDGAFTYLVPDLAYHHDKFLRGFDQYINVFGADHGGYPPRLRAGIAALGHDHEKLIVTLLRLVFLKRNGNRVKFSKRAGNFVALSDVVEDAGADATRWFMLCRSIDSEFEFDMDLALQSTSQNPVFKVQYAHARIASMTTKGEDEGFLPLADAARAVELLADPLERDMILFLGQFPDVVDRSARELSVHHIPAYLLALADLWNSYYTKAKTDDSFRILRPEARELSAARLLLAAAIRQTLANGLGLLGIGAPTKMVKLTRDEEA